MHSGAGHPGIVQRLVTKCGPSAWLQDLETVDRVVHAAIAHSPTPTLDGAMERLSVAANYSRLSLASGAMLAVARGRRGRRAAQLGFASVAVTATIVNLAIKPLGNRRRPDRGAFPGPRARRARRVRMPASRSMPSGHTASAFAFATGVSHVLPWDGALLHLLAAAVGYSRVHTGVHYPSDVIFGALTGTVVSHLVLARLDPAGTGPSAPITAGVTMSSDLAPAPPRTTAASADSGEVR
jgi:membrane-associated phospholipid phosphatase